MYFLIYIHRWIHSLLLFPIRFLSLMNYITRKMFLTRENVTERSDKEVQGYEERKERSSKNP